MQLAFTLVPLLATPVCDRRRADNVLEQCAKLTGHPVVLPPYNHTAYRQCHKNFLIAGLQACGGQNCLLFEDDAVFVDDVLGQLDATLAALPENWTTFHFCPGFLHGRRFRRRKTSFNPEDARGRGRHEHRRWFRATNVVGAPGGPVAMLVRGGAIGQVVRRLRAARHCSPDIALERPPDAREFHARDPRLCRELLPYAKATC